MDTLLQPYPRYKPTNVQCLGNVPAHWEVRRLRTVAEMRVSNVDKHTREDEFPVRLCNYVDVYKHDRITSAMPFMTATASPDEIERFRLERDDVLITKDSEAWDDIGVPALVTEAADDLLSGYHLALLRPFEEILGSYLAHALQSKAVAYQFHVRANGVTRYGLTHTGIQSVRIPLPPLPEQRAIVRYLDHADRRIRRYVAAKRKLIALLEEEKQAIITQAVTRGLDPNVPLKPSGVEWLGDVPEHWEVVRNGQLFVQRNEKGFPELPILEVSLRTGVDLRDFENSDRKQMMAVRGQYKRAVKGDIAYNMMRMWQGAIGVAPVDGLVSPAYVVAKPLRGNDPRYFSALFRTSAYMAEVDKYSRGIVKDRNRLYWEDFKQMPTPCPPLHEQVLIADAIDQGLATLNDGANHTRREIELLQEYRTRLVADVVTGKLDVRAAAAQLPDEADDQDPIEESGPLADGLDEVLYDIDESVEELAIESEVTA